MLCSKGVDVRPGGPGCTAESAVGVEAGKKELDWRDLGIRARAEGVEFTVRARRVVLGAC